jgi:hypothetical protein
MIVASAAWSTSVTKSFGALVFTFSRSRSSEARLMIAPALRAALMAMLSMGCRACDMAKIRLGLAVTKSGASPVTGVRIIEF